MRLNYFGISIVALYALACAEPPTQHAQKLAPELQEALVDRLIGFEKLELNREALNGQVSSSGVLVVSVGESLTARMPYHFVQSDAKGSCLLVTEATGKEYFMYSLRADKVALYADIQKYRIGTLMDRINKRNKI